MHIYNSCNIYKHNIKTLAVYFLYQVVVKIFYRVLKIRYSLIYNPVNCLSIPLKDYVIIPRTNSMGKSMFLKNSKIAIVILMKKMYTMKFFWLF